MKKKDIFFDIFSKKYCDYDISVIYWKQVSDKNIFTPESQREEGVLEIKERRKV